MTRNGKHLHTRHERNKKDLSAKQMRINDYTIDIEDCIEDYDIGDNDHVVYDYLLSHNLAELDTILTGLKNRDEDIINMIKQNMNSDQPSMVDSLARIFHKILKIARFWSIFLNPPFLTKFFFKSMLILH